jgi:hypothetical protein
MRHNVTLYARRHHAFGPRVKDLHVVIDEDESGAFNVVADNLDEVLDPYRADRGYAVLGPWEDDYAYRIDCRVESGLAAAGNYMGLGSRPAALAAFRARFRAWVHEEAKAKIYAGVPEDVVRAARAKGVKLLTPRIVPKR